MPIGLFVNATADEIRRIFSRVSVVAVQLHGEEPPELVAELKPIKIIKAIHLAAGDVAVLDRSARRSAI